MHMVYGDVLKLRHGAQANNIGLNFYIVQNHPSMTELKHYICQVNILNVFISSQHRHILYIKLSFVWLSGCCKSPLDMYHLFPITSI